MEITLIAVGKTSTPWVRTGFDEYVKRLGHYTTFRFIEIADLKNARSLSHDQQKQREGELILKQLQPSDRVVLLDERGRQPRSVDFARQIDRYMQTGVRRLVFIIGGPFGFSPDVYARADEQLSLSALTFSHEMVRVFFVEQLYRAHTILRGEKYHHE